MPQPVILIRVFVASPTDVGAERDALKSVTDQINHTVALARGVQIFLVRWEDDVHPGFADDAQAVVNAQIDFSSIDLFIGILWKRFGTPTKRGDSGSTEEFEKCYRLWAETKRPQLMLYFSSAAVSPQDTDPEELGKVLSFKKRVAASGGLYANYDGPLDFREKIRRHLEQYLEGFRSAEETQGGKISFPPSNIPLPKRAGIRGNRFRQVALAREHRFAVYALAFSPDDRLLVSGDREGVIRTWTLEKLDEGILVEKSAQVGHRAGVRRVAFSRDGRFIASFGQDDAFKAWLLGADAELSEVIDAGGVRVSSWAFEPKGRLIVTAGRNGLRLMNPVTWSAEQTWAQESLDAREFTFSPDGLLLAAAYDSGALVLWDMRQFRIQFTLRTEGPVVDFLHFSPDSRLLATCGRESFVSVWNTRGGELATKLELPTDTIQAVAFSHDGRLLAAGDWDGRIGVWER